MKGSIVFVWLTALIVGALCSQAGAAPWQQWRGSGGWGMGGAYQRMYDPAKVETVTGEVVAVEQAASFRGARNGIHLRLRTDRETIPVHLGPAWFIERQDTKIEKGDRVEVKGARVEFDGKPALIAAQVKKGDAVLRLRDDSGVPVWAGWRK